MVGAYNEGPADSMNVIFYKDRHGQPGKIVAQFTVVPPYYNGNGGFPLDLGKGARLKPGHYWLSIQANQEFKLAGQWSWEVSSGIVVNHPAVWRNPGDASETGCTDWTVTTACIPDGEGDHLFTLKGKVW